jgi:ParB family chromosome partitioning protein
MSLKEQPKRLGRGLAALLGDSAVPASVSAPGVQSLGVEVLEPSPFQPRLAMDDGALEELAVSIAQRGILQPLLVRPHPGKAGAYQIIAGERRWRAAQKAQLHEVPVLVRELSDMDAMAAGLVENLQRTDLNPIEEALGYQRLLKEFNMTQERLAEAIGKSRTHITQSLRMLGLPAKVLYMVRNGELSVGHARVLAGTGNPEAVARRVLKGSLTVRQTEDLVNRIARQLDGGTAPARVPVDNPSETETVGRALSEKLGLTVKLTFNGNGGTVTLNYKTLDQLDEILALLNG